MSGGCARPLCPALPCIETLDQQGTASAHHASRPINERTAPTPRVRLVGLSHFLHHHALSPSSLPPTLLLGYPASQNPPPPFRWTAPFFLAFPRRALPLVATCSSTSSMPRRAPHETEDDESPFDFHSGTYPLAQGTEYPFADNAGSLFADNAGSPFADNAGYSPSPMADHPDPFSYTRSSTHQASNLNSASSQTAFSSSGPRLLAIHSATSRRLSHLHGPSRRLSDTSPRNSRYRQSLQDFDYPEPLSLPSSKLSSSKISSSMRKSLRQSQILDSEKHDLLGQALQSDPIHLRDQVDEVLGLASKHGVWMLEGTKASSVERSPKEGASPFASEEPVLRPGYRLSAAEHPVDPLAADSDLTYNIPMITLNNAELAQQIDRDSHDSNLEAGLFVPLQHTQKLAVLSPAKFLGLLTRISDRVAGSSNPPAPTIDTHPGSFGPFASSSDLHSMNSAGSTSPLQNVNRMSNSATSLASFGLQTNHSLLRNFSSDSINSISLDDLQGSPQKSLKNRYSGHTDHLSSIYNNPKENSSKATSRVSSHVDSDYFAASVPSNPEFPSQLFGKSLCIFSADSKFRQWCHRTASRKITNTIILSMILAQSAVLVSRQWSSNSINLESHANYADWVLLGINAFYTVEIFVKVVAYGLVNDSALFETTGIEYPTSNLWYAWIAIRGKFRDLLQVLTFTKRKQPTAALATRNDSLAFSSLPEPPTRDEITKKYSSHDVRFVSQRLGSISSVVPLSPKKRLFEANTFVKTHKLLKTVEEMNLKRAFLRSSWQRLDFVSVLSFWISLILQVSNWDYDNHFMLFRALGCIRIWRLLNLTTGTNIILRACQSAIPQLIDVGIFVVCFWVIFAIIGVQSFKSSLSRHCVWTNPDDPSETYINSDLFCGAYLGTDGHPHPYLDRLGHPTGYVKGWWCPVNSVCQSGENPYGGTVSFDNILQSMQAVFVMISVNTFSDTMYNVMNTDSVAAALFFVVGIYILTVWLMNIFTAIIVASFDFVQMEEKEERKRKAEASQNDKSLKSRKAKLKSWFFNDELHSQLVLELIQRKPWLKRYYRLEFLFSLIITLSLITQSFRSHNMREKRAMFLYRIEALFTGILLLEIILRFLLYLPDWRTFFISHRNIVDLTLAVITSVIIVGPVKDRLGHAYYWMSVFQLARFYRVVLSFRITSDLWIKITKNFKAIYDLTLFYFILLVLTGIIVSRYFEGTVPLDEVDDVQFAMHTLPNTIMTLYVITSTENWGEVMYTLQSYARNVAQRSFGAVILIVWFVVSNLVIMNIFIAVIAKSLEVSLEGRRKHQLRQFIDDMTKRLLMVKDPPGWMFRLKAKWFKSREEKNIEKAVTNLLLSGSAVNDFLNGEEEKDIFAEASRADEGELSKSFIERWALRCKRFVLKSVQNPFYAQKKMKTDVGNFEPSKFATQVLAERRSLIKSQDDYLKTNPSFNTAFYMLQPGHKLRRMCQRIVSSSFGERIDGVEPHKTIGDIFSIVMFLSTVGIVIAACYLTPIYRLSVQHKDGRWNWLFFIDVSFQAIFTMEFLIKVTADGLVFTPNAYARLPWNWLDFGALVSLWIEFVAYLINDGDLTRIVRGLKALRALRLLTISETAKNNFHYTMLSGFSKILSATVISLTLLFPFSLWALNVFNGRLGYCLDGDSGYSACVNEFGNLPFNWEVLSPNVYTNPYLHMDSFGSSFSTLYQIVSLEGWTDLLINVMQSTGVGTPQEMFASPINGLFVIAFIFISTVFILTLFVSVVINNYAKVTGKAYLTDVQIQWYHVKKFLREVRPSKRRDVRDLRRFKRFCYRLTVEKNKAWNSILGLVLILHLFALVFEAFPAWVPGAAQYALFFISTFCFLAHYAMMIVAQGYKVFVSNKWNVFCFLVTLGAWISTCTSLQLPSGNVFINFNKIFLVALLVFLFPRSDRLNQLLKFASASFPSLFSLIYTWFIIYLAYAIAMNQVFGLTKIGPNTSNNINLRSVPKALILLFRCSFGEGWNYIMLDFTVEEPYCVVDAVTKVSDCGNKQYAFFFFMSWNIISMYIMLNLFVSLILDSFSYIAGGTDYHHLIARPEIRKFKRSWQQFDPQGTGFIDVACLGPLLHNLQGSLSFQLYQGSLSIPNITSKWIRRHSSNPYDITVDCAAINRFLLEMDVPKIQERRRLLEQFTEEVKVNMELHEEPGISFTRLITQVPLYTAFDPCQCLVLIDFLENRLMKSKVDERLKKNRCIDLIRGYACRWRYKQWRRGELTTEQFWVGSDTPLEPEYSP